MIVRNKQNTLAIIKSPFWQMAYQNPKAVYACVNQGEVIAPQEIKNSSICIDGDIGAVLNIRDKSTAINRVICG